MKRASQFITAIIFSGIHVISYSQTRNIKEFKLTQESCAHEVNAYNLTKLSIKHPDHEGEEIILSKTPMLVKGKSVRINESIFFQISFYHDYKKIKRYINNEDFAKVGDVYEATIKNHKYLLVEFVQEYATSYWLFQEISQNSSVILVLKNMYLRGDDNAEIEKKLEYGKEYWVQEEKGGISLFFKRGRKNQCKRIVAFPVNVKLK